MISKFEELSRKISTIKKAKQSPDANGLFFQEVLRFHSIAGTLLGSNVNLTKDADVNSRYISHILTRSLLENFFLIMYLFDDPDKTADRFEELTERFKKDYKKLMTDLNSDNWKKFIDDYGSELGTSHPPRSNQKTLPNVNDMLMQICINYKDSLIYLYPLYRICSFDTHGRNLSTILEAVFSKETCKFPVLDIKYAFDLIADYYLCLLEKLDNAG